MRKLSLFILLSNALLLSACDTTSEEISLPSGTKAVLLRDFSLDRKVGGVKPGDRVFYVNTLNCVTKSGELKDSFENYDECYQSFHCELFLVSDEKAGLLPKGYSEKPHGARRAYGRDGWGKSFSYFMIDFTRDNGFHDEPRIDYIRCSTSGNFDSRPIEFEDVKDTLRNYVSFE